MSRKNMSESGPGSDFDGVNVSKGFIRGLQKQIIKLEQNQQDLITQIEHANALAMEFHETSVIYHKKYDQVLYEMEELKRKHEEEIAILFEKIECANQETLNERAINQVHSEQISLLEMQLAEQICDAQQSQATTILRSDEDDEYQYEPYVDHEILSPVSVSLPTPTLTRQRISRGHTPTIDLEDEDENDDEHAHDNQNQTQEQDLDEYERDPAAYWKKEYPKWCEKYCIDANLQGEEQEEEEEQCEEDNENNDEDYDSDDKEKGKDDSATQADAKPVVMWKVIPTVELLDYDDQRNIWRKKITFVVKPFNVFQKRDDRLPQSPPPKPVKRYDYFYTGHNSSVIGFDIDFNALYFNAFSIISLLRTLHAVFGLMYSSNFPSSCND